MYIHLADNEDGELKEIVELAFFNDDNERIPLVQSTKTAYRDTKNGEKALIDGKLTKSSLYNNGEKGLNFAFPEEVSISTGRIVLTGENNNIPRMITIYINRKVVFQKVLKGTELSDGRMLEYTFVCDNKGNSNESTKRIIINKNREYMPMGSDIYSTDESITNKMFKGKPVYRKLVELGDLSHMYSSKGKWHTVEFGIENIDTQISAARYGSTNIAQGYYQNNSKWQVRSMVMTNCYKFVFTKAYQYLFENTNFIVEYTKTTD